LISIAKFTEKAWRFDFSSISVRKSSSRTYPIYKHKLEKTPSQPASFTGRSRWPHRKHDVRPAEEEFRYYFAETPS
jgi:hypothetical protein